VDIKPLQVTVAWRPSVLLPRSIICHVSDSSIQDIFVQLK